MAASRGGGSGADRDDHQGSNTRRRAGTGRRGQGDADGSDGAAAGRLPAGAAALTPLQDSRAARYAPWECRSAVESGAPTGGAGAGGAVDSRALWRTGHWSGATLRADIGGRASVDGARGPHSGADVAAVDSRGGPVESAAPGAPRPRTSPAARSIRRVAAARWELPRLVRGPGAAPVFDVAD